MWYLPSLRCCYSVSSSSLLRYSSVAYSSRVSRWVLSSNSTKQCNDFNTSSILPIIKNGAPTQKELRAEVRCRVLRCSCHRVPSKLSTMEPDESGILASLYSAHMLVYCSSCRTSRAGSSGHSLCPIGSCLPALSPAWSWGVSS